MSAVIASRSAREAGFVRRILSQMFSRSAKQGFDLFGEGNHLASTAYRYQRDKGSTKSLWHHIDEVREEVVDMYKDMVTPEHLSVLKLKANLHEILEVKDAHRKYIYTPDDIRALGFPEDFVSSLTHLNNDGNTPYLRYIHQLALSDDRDAIMIKLADIRVNSRPREHEERPLSDKLIDKKTYVYFGAERYLTGVLNGEIDPRQITPLMFFGGDGLTRLRIPSGRSLGEAIAPYWNYETPVMSRRTTLSMGVLVAGAAGLVGVAIPRLK
jgi:hypothetical protein